MFFDVAIYESGNIEGGGASLIRSLRDGEGVKQLIKNLDRLLILRLGIGRI